MCVCLSVCLEWHVPSRQGTVWFHFEFRMLSISKGYNGYLPAMLAKLPTLKMSFFDTVPSLWAGRSGGVSWYVNSTQYNVMCNMLLTRGEEL